MSVVILSRRIMREVRIIPASDKFDLLASTYDDTPAGYYEQWDGPVLMNMLGDASEKYILDIGCGTGRLLESLQKLGTDTVGIDLSDRMAEEARKKSVLALQADIVRFEWSEPFDIVLSVLTFNYIEYKAAAIAVVRSVLKPDGLFIISSDLQTEDTPVERGKDLVAAKYFSFSKDQYSRLLGHTGFQVEESVDLFWSVEFKDTSDPENPIGFIIKARKKARS